MALSLARVYQAEVLLCHVVDTQSLEALNHLGLALPSEESAQKKSPCATKRVSMRGVCWDLKRQRVFPFAGSSRRERRSWKLQEWRAAKK